MEQVSAYGITDDGITDYDTLLKTVLSFTESFIEAMARFDGLADDITSKISVKIDELRGELCNNHTAIADEVWHLDTAQNTSLYQLDIRLDAEEWNRLARKYNELDVLKPDDLYQHMYDRTKIQVPGQPASPRHLKFMQIDDIDNLLSAFSLPLDGRSTIRRSRLQHFMGGSNNPLQDFHYELSQTTLPSESDRGSLPVRRADYSNGQSQEAMSPRSWVERHPHPTQLFGRTWTDGANEHSSNSRNHESSTSSNGLLARLHDLENGDAVEDDRLYGGILANPLRAPLGYVTNDVTPAEADAGCYNPKLVNLPYRGADHSPTPAGSGVAVSKQANDSLPSLGLDGGAHAHPAHAKIQVAADSGFTSSSNGYSEENQTAAAAAAVPEEAACELKRPVQVALGPAISTPVTTPPTHNDDGAGTVPLVPYASPNAYTGPRTPTVMPLTPPATVLREGGRERGVEEEAGRELV